jgi:dihydrolipoamide dehydrogenase
MHKIRGNILNRFYMTAKKGFSDTYDLCIIGGGPGGYISAIKGGQKNLKTVCIEKRGTLGGTCLNVGCIPSKSLLNTSLKYYEAKHHFDQLGIVAKDISFDFNRVMDHKTKVVGQLCQGIEGLFKKNKVDYLKGYAKFKDENTLEVDMNDGSKKIVTAKNFIIATGSEPNELPGGILPIDENHIVSSTGALSLKKVPEKLTVIGAGVIGLELGSVYSRLGSKVEVIEFANKILPPFDNEISSTFQRFLVKQGITFHLGTKVIGGSLDGSKVKYETENISNGKKEVSTADVLLVSTGRRPFTRGLQLDKVGISVDKFGRIPVDKHLRTSKKHIYAIGDVIEGPMLAHKGEEEGVATVEHICGEYSHVNYQNIPSVVYTHPEIATLGYTEEELKEKSKTSILIKINVYNTNRN